MGRAPRRGAARAGHHGDAAVPGCAHPRSHHLPVQHPHHLGLRRLGRLQLPAPGPQRRPERRAAGRAQPPVPGGRPQAAGDRQPLHVVRPALSPGQGRARPREGAQAGRAGQRGLPGAVHEPGRQLRERLQPLRTPVPRLRAGGGRLPAQARGHRPDLGAQQDHERHDPPRDAGHHHLPGRDGAHQPLQPAALGRAQRRARPRLRLGPGARRPGGRLQADDAAGDGLRLLLALLPGEDRAARGTDLRRRHPLRLPAAGRHVRELAPALGGAARLAAGGPGGLLRGLARGLRQQRLRPDRQHHAHRPRRQERHPDRGVRQGQAREGRLEHPGGGARIGAAALPADPDDRLRLHPGRHPADARQRRRRGSAERHGHRRLLGHAGRHRPRRFPDPGQLRVRGAAGPQEEGEPAAVEPPVPQPTPSTGAVH